MVEFTTLQQVKSIELTSLTSESTTEEAAAAVANAEVRALTINSIGSQKSNETYWQPSCSFKSSLTKSTATESVAQVFSGRNASAEEGEEADQASGPGGRGHYINRNLDHQSHLYESGGKSSNDRGQVIADSNHSNESACSSGLGYHLRALKEDLSALEANPWIRTPALPNDINVSSFSTELVNETLNYFVNCSQRLSQMTKTYDDNDAYLLLLQEKEVDLELAARIGQDLLKQNKQLKDSIKNLEKELSDSQDEVQQLKHELASKASLLDTFIEDEEEYRTIDDSEIIKPKCVKPTDEQQRLVQSVSFQLVESNKRLCELQDELFYRGEQNLLQQEKIYHLQEQLRESDRRLGDIATENESLQGSILGSVEQQRDLMDELKICKRNFSDLLQVFLELQKESRLYKMKEMQQNSNVGFFEHLEPVATYANNISFDSFNETSFTETHDSAPYEAFNHNEIKPSYSNTTVPNTSSLLVELQESLHNNGEDTNSDGDSSDGGDSGVHTNNNISSPSSVTPSANGPTGTDSDDSSASDISNGKNWLGLSSFMLTTILILCLSVTLNAPSNLNLVHKFQER